MERKAFLQHVSLFLCHNIYFLLFLTLLIFFHDCYACPDVLL